MIGMGLGDALRRPAPKMLNSLITRLSLGIASIHAGNTSAKLRKEMASIADILFHNNILSKEQKKKIRSLK